MTQINLKDDVQDLAKTYTHEIIKDAKKADKHTENIIIVVILLVLHITLIAILITSISAYKSVTSTASDIAGTVVGTLSGISDIPETYNNGKYDGLSAEDTTASISNEISNIGKLEVLEAGVTIENFHKYSDKYASLSIGKGKAIFTIDLANAKISCNDKVISIHLLEPDVSLYINETETKKLAEWQEHSWTGTTTDGYTAYLNSWNNSKKEIKDSIADYESLMDEAKEQAETTVTNLLKGFTTKSFTFVWQENSNEKE